jgi:hypothetical protein
VWESEAIVSESGMGYPLRNRYEVGEMEGRMVISDRGLLDCPRL